MKNNLFFKEIAPFTRLLDKHHYCLPQSYCEKGIRLFATSTVAFRNKYSFYHLAKVLNVFCTFEDKIQKNEPNQKKIYFRLLKIHHPENHALGIAVVLKVSSHMESFSSERLLQSILHIIPGVIAVPDSTYHYRDEATGIIYAYLEIEKKRGRGFTHSDTHRLVKYLPKELEEGVETYSPSLFLIHNEEEIFRTIVHLGRELSAPHDVPQVTISFQEQGKKGILRFSIVVVRIVNISSPSLRELSKRLPHTINCIPEIITQIGIVDKEHSKQANILSCEIDGNVFTRTKNGIDLREVRSYIAKALQLMIGEFRDYNGGLLTKHSQLLSELELSLSDEDSELLKSLFYSIAPANFQSFILPEALKACSALLLKAKNTPSDPHSPYTVYKCEEKIFHLILIQTGNKAIYAAAVNEAANLTAPMHQFGYATHSIEGDYFLWLIYQYPLDSSWFETMEQRFLNYGTAGMPPEKKFLRINFQDGDPLSLNPHIGLDLRCRSLLKALFEGLTRIDPHGQAELAAAYKVDISDDGKTYLFTLRRHQWSNGEHVTAFQYEKTWKQAIKSPSCLRPDLFFVIQNARLARFGQAQISTVGISALDSWRLRVTLEYPAPYFLQLVALPLFFPLHEECGEPYAFNGPFTLHSWTRDQRLTLVKNPYYWDFENVKLQGVEISIIRDSQLATKKYDQGELDWIGGPFSILPPSVSYERADQLQRADIPGVCWLYCNLNHPLLSSVHIRKALACALDREQICKKTFGYTPLKTHLPQEFSFLEDHEIYAAPDQRLALEYFEKGIKESSCSRGRLPKLTLFHSHIAGQKELAHEVQRQWQDLFKLNITTVEEPWNTFSHQLDNRLIHFGCCYRHPYYHDPSYFFDIFYEPTNIHNAFGWHDTTFEKVMNEARHSTHKGIFLKMAENILLDQMPVIPIHGISQHYLASKKVSGIYFCHSGDVDFKWIHFRE